MSIADNIEKIRGELAPLGREYLLVAATKTQTAAAVREAIAGGVDACGENRVQELVEKHAQDAYLGAPLHFIGHLQRNKLRHVVGVATLIESVDSSELLTLIARRAVELGICQDVLLELNVAGEASKFGAPVSELSQLLDTAAALTGIRVRGLMAIPPISDIPGGNRGYFAAMRQLFVDIGEKKYDNVSMEFLSMGMSRDYREAVAEGSNMIRVGTAIFGPRQRQ